MSLAFISCHSLPPATTDYSSPHTKHSLFSPSHSWSILLVSSAWCLCWKRIHAMRRCLPQRQSFPPENPIMCRPSSPSGRFEMVVQCCRHRDLCNLEYVPTLASQSGESSSPLNDKNQWWWILVLTPASNLSLYPVVACACETNTKLNNDCTGFEKTHSRPREGLAIVILKASSDRWVPKTTNNKRNPFSGR